MVKKVLTGIFSLTIFFSLAAFGNSEKNLRIAKIQVLILKWK